MWRAMALCFALLVLTSAAHADATVTLCNSDDQSGAGTNLAAAIPGGGRITFACGSGATILMNCHHEIVANTDIDGGGTVTLKHNPAGPCASSLGSIHYALFHDKPAQAFSFRLTSLRIVGVKPPPQTPISQLKGQLAADSGGALTTGCDSRISSTVFTNNKARSGGALYIGDSAAHTNLVAVNFESNTANEGGAISIRGEIYAPVPPDQAVELHGVTFKSNQAQVGAALEFARFALPGVALNKRSLTAAGTQFINNHATLFGGGLLLARAQAAFDGVLFMGNKADQSGGAMVVLEDGDGRLAVGSEPRSRQICFEPEDRVFIGGAYLQDLRRRTARNSISRELAHAFDDLVASDG